ncbi:MAG: hypothetical protein ACJ705_03060 [Nitrososphaeraceae archaeon]
MKDDGGRMMISDLVTDREGNKDSVNPEKWCSCIDGALIKKNYLDSIRKAGFKNVEILEEKAYTEETGENDRDIKRKISSLLIKGILDLFNRRSVLPQLTTMTTKLLIAMQNSVLTRIIKYRVEDT